MRYLYRYELEKITDRIIKKYRILAPPEYGPQRINPVFIASDILGLAVEHAGLSSDGSILGVTSYDMAAVRIYDEESDNLSYILDGKTILIEKSLCEEGQTGRYHFTVAHELSHQILRLLYPSEYGIRYRKTEAVYYRDSREQQIDREEWQADALAVEILMPPELIQEVMRMYGFRNGIKRLNRIFDGEEYRRFSWAADYLGVSKEALSIRLQQLGLLKENELKNPYTSMDVYV